MKRTISMLTAVWTMAALCMPCTYGNAADTTDFIFAPGDSVFVTSCYEPYPEDFIRESVDTPHIEDTTEIETIYLIMEQLPEFPGGEEALRQYLADSIRYPEQAVADSIEGRVICRMVIHKDGSVSDVEVLRGVHPLLDAEAIRVIEAMPKWTPGKVKGEAVDAYLPVPVVFRLK